jgi:hypothetical protein
MAAQQSAECAHAPCKCHVPKGGQHARYCSEHCKEKGEQIELRCDCGHAECR